MLPTPEAAAEWADSGCAGYSCARSPEDLIAYFEERGHPQDDEPVVVFGGTQAGVGLDGEPLVIPAEHPRPRCLTYGQVRRAVERRQQRRR